MAGNCFALTTLADFLPAEALKAHQVFLACSAPAALQACLRHHASRPKMDLHRLISCFACCGTCCWDQPRLDPCRRLAIHVGFQLLPSRLLLSLSKLLRSTLMRC